MKKIILLFLIFILNSPVYSMCYRHTTPPSQNIRYMSPKIYTPNGYNSSTWLGKEHCNMFRILKELHYEHN